MIAVTGASGFVGRHLCEFLAAKPNGERVRILTRAPGKVPRFGPSVEIFSGSLEDEAAVRAFVAGAGTVVNLATAAGSARDDEARMREVDVNGTARLFAAAVAEGCSAFLHVSTAGVYGQPRLAPPAAESDTVDPVTAYQRTKYAGEQALLGAGAGATILNILRPADLYGSGSRVHVGSYRKVLQSRWSYELPGDILLHPTHVLDLVRAIDALIERPAPHGSVFNIAGERPVREHDLYAIAAEVLGVDRRRIVWPALLAAPYAAVRAKIAHAKGRAKPMLAAMGRGVVFNTAVDDRRFRESYPDVPVMPLREGVEEHIAWARAHGLL